MYWILASNFPICKEICSQLLIIDRFHPKKQYNNNKSLEVVLFLLLFETKCTMWTNYKCMYTFLVSDIVEVFILLPFRSRLLTVQVTFTFLWKPFSLSSFIFAEISERYKPFYYENLGKNIEDDLKNLKVSSLTFLTYLCPCPNYGQILPLQHWFLTDMISCCDKMAGFVNEGRAVHVIYLNLQKVFKTLSQTTLVFKFRCCCLDEQMKTGWMVSPRGEQLMGPTSPAGQKQLQECRGLGPDLVYSCVSDLTEVMNTVYTKLEGLVNTVTGIKLIAAGWSNVVTKPCEIQKAQEACVVPGIK